MAKNSIIKSIFLLYLFPKYCRQTQCFEITYCLFKVPRLVCFVLINPPFSNTQRRQCCYSSGSEREASHPSTWLGSQGPRAVMAANMYRVGGKVAGKHFSALMQCLYSSLAMIRRRSLCVLKRGLSFLPFYYFLLAKEPYASLMMVVTVRRGG